MYCFPPFLIKSIRESLNAVMECCVPTDTLVPGGVVVSRSLFGLENTRCVYPVMSLCLALNEVLSPLRELFTPQYKVVACISVGSDSS